MTIRRLCVVFLLCWSGSSLHAQPWRSPKNLLPNGSFEQVRDGVPVGWQWRAERASATLKVTQAVAHSGRHSLQLVNPTPAAPHVFSRLSTSVSLEPGRTYTLSCFVRSRSPGVAWVGGGDGWRIRQPLPTTGDDWQRVQITFQATDADRQCEVMILTESPTDGLWVDDIQLEEGAAATEFEVQQTLPPGATRLWLKPVTPRPNLLPNPSFETIEGDRLKSWRWDRRNTDASMTLDRTVARSGACSLRFTNSTAFGAHVYGLLTLVGGVQVKPNTPYTFSCYVRGEDPGIAWFGGGRDWRIRAHFPDGEGTSWSRVALTFTTGAEETQIPVMIVTESPTDGFWVDDVQLVEGNEPMPFLPEAGEPQPLLEIGFARPWIQAGRGPAPAWNPTQFPPDRYIFAGRELWMEGLLHVPQPVTNACLVARLSTLEGKRLAQESRSGNLQAGVYLVSFGWGTGDTLGGDAVLSLSLEADQAGGQPLHIEATAHRRLVTPGDVEAALQRVETARRRLEGRLDSLRRKRSDPSYPLVTLTILRDFVGYARQDVEHGEIARAYDAALQMEAMAGRALSREFLPPVPRYVTPAQGRPYRVEGPALLGGARWPDGRTESKRPLQFVGHGHFGQVRNDLEKFPGYGVNIIQIEFGPNSVLPAEGQVKLDAIDEFLRVCDRAARAGVTVNLLVSPHYFPGWAMEKWPFLADCTGGFFRYCVHAPESRQVLEAFLRVVIPRIRRHPALHSLCLSNEPLSLEVQNCRYLPDQWHDWLRRQHGTIERLNQHWGAEYARFDEIPIPPTGMRPEPICYDFVRFNQEVFAGFHAWMAGIIREMAPEIPVHAKIMIGAHFGRHPHGPWSIDPELFGALSDFNGNDCWKSYLSRGEWASSWQAENMGYDFQRSVADKPIFNSENHIIPDRHLDAVPPEYIANLYWQGAIHGQSATTTWVWERTDDPASDFAGSIMHRPACVEALGHTALDLMRLSEEVTAFQRLQPPVVLLWSLASVTYGEEHLAALGRLYEGLNFGGVRVGFVTERQLRRLAETGEVPLSLRGAQVVLVPQVTHSPATTLEGLRRFSERGGRVVLVGPCFGQDEYDHPRPGETLRAEQVELPASARAVLVWAEEHFPAWGIERAVTVRTSDGELAWGVEYLTLKHNDRWLVNLTNYRREPQRVRILIDGLPAGGRDLLSGEQVEATFELPALRPMLVEVERKG